MKKIIIAFVMCVISTMFVVSCSKTPKSTMNIQHHNGVVEVAGVPVSGDTSGFTNKVSTFGVIEKIKRDDNYISYHFVTPKNEDSIYIWHVEVYHFNGQIASVFFTYRNTTMLDDAIVEKYKKYDNFIKDYDAWDYHYKSTSNCYKIEKTRIIVGKPSSIFNVNTQKVEYKTDDVWEKMHSSETKKEIGDLNSKI